MSLARARSSAVITALVIAAAALALAPSGCDETPAPGAHPSASSASSASSSTPAAPASSPAAAGTATPTAGGQGAAPIPDTASAITDTPPALSASAPPKETSAVPATKPTASAKATASVKPTASAAPTASASAAPEGSAKAEASAKPADKPADLPPPAAGSPDAIAAQIDTIFVGKKTFSARFKQEFTQKVSGVVKKSTGTLFVEKPNKISFRYDPPNKNRIVSDGTTLKVYIAEDTQMFVQPVQKTEYPGALSFLMGSGLRPSFTFTLNDKAKFEGGPVLLGKPRSPTPHYEYVMFYIDKALLEKGDPNVVRRVLIVDAQGNKNRFDFEGASQPASIDPGEFTFTPPEGTSITNEASKK